MDSTICSSYRTNKLTAQESIIITWLGDDMWSQPYSNNVIVSWMICWEVMSVIIAYAMVLFQMSTLQCDIHIPFDEKGKKWPYIHWVQEGKLVIVFNIKSVRIPIIYYPYQDLQTSCFLQRIQKNIPCIAIVLCVFVFQLSSHLTMQRILTNQ